MGMADDGDDFIPAGEFIDTAFDTVPFPAVICGGSASDAQRIDDVTEEYAVDVVVFLVVHRGLMAVENENRMTLVFEFDGVIKLSLEIVFRMQMKGVVMITEQSEKAIFRFEYLEEFIKTQPMPLDSLEREFLKFFDVAVQEEAVSVFHIVFLYDVEEELSVLGKIVPAAAVTEMKIAEDDEPVGPSELSR